MKPGQPRWGFVRHMKGGKEVRPSLAAITTKPSACMVTVVSVMVFHPSCLVVRVFVSLLHEPMVSEQHMVIH